MNLINIFKKFPNQEDCITHLEKIKWDNKAICPYCKESKTTKVVKEQRYHCNNCNTSFSVTVNTIFHHTHLPLQKCF